MPRILTAANFATISQFVVREGDRQTYGNMYNDNPHLAVHGFDVFLNPDVGQQNINCDPERSGFDEMVFRDEQAAGGYLSVKLTADGLSHEPDARGPLEYYFAALLAHISGQ